jgi:GNAT superfamily N-acetyltransferase
MPRIALAESDEDIERCHEVMRFLRPHIEPSQFVERVRRQQRDGYRLAFREAEGAVQSVAGYRILENLAWGRFLYVDDLVSAEGRRSAGHGGALFDWLVEQARAAGCDQFHLDSGVQRFGAHRFYLTKRMDITSHHFAIDLRPV